MCMVVGVSKFSTSDSGRHFSYVVQFNIAISTTMPIFDTHLRPTPPCYSIQIDFRVSELTHVLGVVDRANHSGPTTR